LTSKAKNLSIEFIGDNMKMFRIVLCFLIIFTLSSCGKNELMSLSDFISSYNRISENDLMLSDFIIQNNPDIVYTAVLPDSSSDILLSMFQGNDNKIKSCRIALIKENGSVPTNEQINDFNKTVIEVLTSYCNYSDIKAKAISDSFNLSNNVTFSHMGELTFKADKYSLSCRLPQQSFAIVTE
jgi:hypothetical protein